ncbi:hypothetical protein [Maridesulfovibrio bastinii]|uniref:hypothetical protein n=1 Tax=Maridesulfovibrio bastinii TaxID=47157 RepID=UPI00040117B3|nr:hypothetical protein [Maridesulfovibrio bastinii]
MWKSIDFNVPASATVLEEKVDSVVNGVPDGLSAAGSRLSVVAEAIPVHKSPIALLAGKDAELTADLSAYLSTRSKFLCVHPYIHPVGDRRGDYAYLSPGGCREAVMAKLADPYEELEGDAAVFVKISGYDNADLANKLAAFNTVFPLVPLQLAQRRAADLAVLEKEKYILGNGFISPKFQYLDERQHSTNKKIDACLAELLGISHGYDIQNKRPETLLQELMAKKRQRSEESLEKWETLSSIFTGGAGEAAFISGSVRTIRNGFSKLGLRDGASPLAVICCWIGEEEAMTVFREVLGI